MNYLHKNILDTTSDNLADTDDYSDNESDDIDYDGISFETPIKNSDNLYIAHLEEKIVIELDNLDVFEIIEENGKHFVFFNLDLDNEDQEELIELLYNLDEVALDKCFENSIEWFKKELSEQQIENLYRPLYIDNYKNKNHILMKVEINSDIDILNITNSNINIIEIKGLVFYQKTFLYHVYLKKIVNEDINIHSCIGDTQKSTQEVTQEVTQEEVAQEEVTQEEATQEVATQEQIRENIEKRIEQQRVLVEEKFLKSQQQNKEAERIQQEAIKSANELKELQLQLQ